jgi:hypothetical protein
MLGGVFDKVFLELCVCLDWIVETALSEFCHLLGAAEMVGCKHC